MDIFSGRENPFWNLSINESEAFMQKFISLPEGNENVSVEGGLGYRGIIITGDLLKDRCIDAVRVFRGLAKAGSGGKVQNFSDPGRSLELWLIETGVNNIDRDLYQLVRKEAAAVN